MSISFQCPQCGKKLKAPESAAGRSSNCPGCGNKVTCPLPGDDEEVVEMQLAPDKPKGFDPFGDLDDGSPYGVSGPPAAAQAPESDDQHALPGAVPAKTKSGKKKKKKKKFGPEDESLTGAEIAVAILCSGIGCIAGIVWMIQGKPKGQKMFGLSIAADLVETVLFVVLRSSLQGGP
jgi:DNA-directed RNA polymerase subunit RPC12/RpoP